MLTEEFQHCVNAQASGPDRSGDVLSVVNELEVSLEGARRKATEIGFTEAEIVGLRQRLIGEAEARWMRTRYATLDLAFAESLQRFVVGRSEADPSAIVLRGRAGENEPADLPPTDTVVSLPVFACEWGSYDSLRRSYSDERGWGFKSEFVATVGNLPAIRLNGTHYRASAVRAVAKMPTGITPKMFARIRHCIAYADLFEVLLLDRGLIDERSEGRRGMEVGVLWAPADDAWAFSSTSPRPKGDPAILIRTRSLSNYLVGYFDTPDEKPIDNLIREFTTGPLGER